MTESANHPTDSDVESLVLTSDRVGGSIGWVAIIGFSLAAFLLLVPLPFEGREASAIGDLAHAPMFGGICLAVLFLWHRISPLDSFGRDWVGRILLVALSVFILGILIEFAQIITGRSASRHDVIANGMGIMASVLICLGLLNRKYHRNRFGLTWFSFATAALVLVIAWSVPLRIINDVVAVQRDFPVISSFESSYEGDRWYRDDSTISFVKDHVTDGEWAMRWHIDAEQHPAITLLELPGDWSEARSFELDVTLDPDFDGEAILVVKVMDHYHADYHEDVCRKQFILKPGQSTHLIVDRDELFNGPDTRKLDLSKIRFVSLLCYQPKQPTWIDIDYMRVEIR